jgi:hypothetical protein
MRKNQKYSEILYNMMREKLLVLQNTNRTFEQAVHMSQ